MNYDDHIYALLGFAPTRISLPVKVVIRIAMAFQIQSRLFARRAVDEWNMAVSDLIEEVDFLLFEHESSSDGMDRRITPSFIEESSILV